MRRLVIMLAHEQGDLLNQRRLARGLGVTATTVQRYLDVLEAAFLVRTVRPYLPQLGKRLVKSPKVYLRDSGFLHGLLRIGTFDDLPTHPVVGQSWAGYVGEQLRRALGAGAERYYYRSARGHEIDYVCEHPRFGRLAFEIERSNAPTLTKSFWTAVGDVGADVTYVVSPSVERHPLGEGVEGIGVREVLGAVLHT